MIGDASLDVPWTDINFETTCSALALQTAEAPQQADYRIEPNGNHEFNTGVLLHLESEGWQSLPVGVGQDLDVTSAISLASAGCTKGRSAQLISSENTKPSNQIVFIAENNVECDISDHNTSTFLGNKAQS